MMRDVCRRNLKALQNLSDESTPKQTFTAQWKNTCSRFKIVEPVKNVGIKDIVNEQVLSITKSSGITVVSIG